MIEKVFRFFNKNKLYHSLLFIFLIITSCDDKVVSLSEDSSITTNYIQKTFTLDAEKSILPNSPIYLNQDLSSRVYVGNIDDSNNSYAIFEIDSQIINKYNICNNNEINSLDNIKFRIVFDSPLTTSDYNDFDAFLNENGEIYSYDNSSLPNADNLTNEEAHDFESAFLDDGDPNVSEFTYERFIKGYFSNNLSIIFNEDDSINHSQEYIDNIINIIKGENNPLPSSLNTAYKLDFDLTQNILNNNTSSMCNGDLDKFYILVEYTPNDINNNDYYDIISSDHFYMDHHPSLLVSYKKASTIDSLINRYTISDINSDLSSISYIQEVNNNIFFEDDEIEVDIEMNFDNNPGDIVVVANTEDTSDGFGTIVGFSSLGIFEENYEPIIPVTEEVDLLDITIDLKDDITSDSLTFYFSDIVFGYLNTDESSYVNGDYFEDFGIDECPDSLETGDTNNPCGATLSESLFNPSGTENNGIYDEGELWNDLGLDWLQGTNTFGVSDDFETGCKNTSYPYGIGYNASNQSVETYSDIIDEIGGIDFYKQNFTLNNGQIIEVCGQEFWDNPNSQEGVASCSACNINDPNGDNKNIDPSNDDWMDVDGNIVGDYDEDGAWSLEEPFEQNGQWDWVDVNGNNAFDINIDEYEIFFDYGIDQLPDNIESGDINYDNYSSSNLDGTENNGQYDIGEIFIDDGIDNLSSQQEDNYNKFGREGNNEVDIIEGDIVFREFNDFGIDNCQNGYELGQDELGQPQCDENENENGDLNFDDFNPDPNNDNFDNNPDGTENNGSYDDGEYFTENLNPLIGLFVLGENLYNVNLNDIETTQNFDKPQSLGSEDIILWISKIEKNNDNQYKLTVSISSSIDISAFQFKLNHIQYEHTIPYLEPNLTQMFPLDFDDLNDNNIPDNGEMNEDVKYISEYSLYTIPNSDGVFFNNEIVLSYGYGTKWNLYFDEFNEFLYLNNQSLFVSEQQTYLTIHFDTESENHVVPDEGVGLNFYGDISENISIENYINSVLVFDDTSNLSIKIGPLVNALLSDSELIFENETDIVNTILNHMELSLSSYSNNFSKIVLDTNKLPHIDILYSE